jgi:hypothetical protein
MMIEDNPVLGAVVASYPSDRGRLLLPAALVTGAVAILLNFTLAEADAWWGPPLTVILMALVALAAGWYVLHHWNREVVLYEDGFSYREGSRPVFFRYTEIATMRQRAERLSYLGGLYRRTVYRFVLTTWQGDVIVLTNLYRRVAELGSRMERKVNAVLWPVIAEKLAKGEIVPFSATLGLSARGLHEGKRELTWSEYGGYRVENRRLTVLNSRGDVWFSLPLTELDNITLLLNVLRQHEPTNSQQLIADDLRNSSLRP